MLIDKAREPIKVQRGFGGGCNRDAVRLTLGEVKREHGQQAVDGIIRKPGLEQASDLTAGADFSRAGISR